MNPLGFGLGSVERQRRRLHRRASQGPLREYLNVPFPAPSTPADRLDLLAVDLETTGLDPAVDRILSVGYVPIRDGTVRLSGARQHVVSQRLPVGQSATIHQLTDDDVADGSSLEFVLTDLLEALRGRVLLAHHAEMERGFLAPAIRSVFGSAPAFSIVDTLLLQARVMRVELEEAPRGTLRLGAAREHFGLPRYRSHEALTDALACAELFLAQQAELAGRGTVSLRTLQRG